MDEDQSGFAGPMPTNLDTMTENDMKDIRNRTAKQLVKERQRLRARIVEATQAADDANTVFIEDMGIDMVMVDEVHEFKKLPIATKQNLKGLFGCSFQDPRANKFFIWGPSFHGRGGKQGDGKDEHNCKS